MKALVRRLATPVAAAALLAPAALAQTTAGIRGKVVDEQGAGIPGVKIDMEFQGESRQKITKTQQTDKKGAFVRMGIPSGPWLMTFTRDGYQTYVMKVELSLGGFSDQPDVVMKAATASATTSAPSAGSPPADAPPALPPESAKLGDVYNKAVEATKAGNLDEAEALYKQVLEKVPNLGEAYYNL